jgi:predicted ArsR family transcriptional regulator
VNSGLARLLNRRIKGWAVHTVRKNILELLKERESATVAELAERLEMPAVSVRHHLDILQGDNLIRVDRLERKGNVGRPQQVYALTTQAAEYFPDNFAALAAGLVRQLKNVLPPEQVEAAFQAMAADLAAELDLAALDQLPTEERLAQVADFLTERGYLARWERSDQGEGFLLHKCNCPYAAGEYDVAGEHPELCLMDQALINRLLGQTCTRTQTMANDARCCTYHIQDAHIQDAHSHETQALGSPVAGPQRIELRVTA